MLASIAAVIRLVHGTPDGVGQLTKTFATAHVDAFADKRCSKAAVQRLIKDPAFCVRETRDGYKAPRRFVCAEVLRKYGSGFCGRFTGSFVNRISPFGL